MTKKKPVIKDPLCKKCNALCCRYIALPLETPTTRADYDNIRWFLAHEGVSVFVQKGDWYINMAARCKHLSRQNLCSIYEHRPAICRQYKDHNCDYHSGEYEYELHFTSLEEFNEYLDSINKLPRTARKKAPKKAVRKTVRKKTSAKKK